MKVVSEVAHFSCLVKTPIIQKPSSEGSFSSCFLSHPVSFKKKVLTWVTSRQHRSLCKCCGKVCAREGAAWGGADAGPARALPWRAFAVAPQAWWGRGCAGPTRRRPRSWPSWTATASATSAGWSPSWRGWLRWGCGLGRASGAILSTGGICQLGKTAWQIPGRVSRGCWESASSKTALPFGGSSLPAWSFAPILSSKQVERWGQRPQGPSLALPPWDPGYSWWAGAAPATQGRMRPLGERGLLTFAS